VNLHGPSAAIVRRTQIVDIARAIPSGVLVPLESSILLTIAIKEFNASGLAKGCIAAAGGFGLLASPFVTSIARKLQRPVTQVTALVVALGALGLIVSTQGHLWMLVIGSIIGLASLNSVIPLTTLTYERNFPTATRGKRVGWGLMLRVAVSAATGLAMGAYLKHHLDRWPFVVMFGAIAAAVQVGLFASIPSTPLDRVPGVRNRPWPHFGLLRTDRQLRLTIFAWMLMGFGNLMLLPLRVEYLAQPKYGIKADAAKIALLTVVVPAIIRLLCTPIYGVVFDRLSFFASRILVNVLFAVYVGAFFTGKSDFGLYFGAVALGVGSAGGDLMWSLWVTKFAPRDRVADYMGIHTFFTGIRATSAPFIGFLVIARFALSTVALVSVTLILAASLVLVPEMRAERARRAAIPATG
jgi:MFS family permease